MQAEDKTPPPRDGVPPELIQKLHENNERFSKAKAHVNEAIDAEVNNLLERERAAKEVAEAEGEIEKVEKQIEDELRKT